MNKSAAQLFTSPDNIRAKFSEAMSAMYRNEVPAYGQLLDIVAAVNDELIQRTSDNSDASVSSQNLSEAEILRLSAERHGAIRLGTADELSTMRRLFSVMGLFPVDYYDLSVAGIPVHSTAFRPISRSSLTKNPFRVFTSLLRLELIEHEALQEKAAEILRKRKIFTPECLSLIDQFESQGGLTESQSDEFVLAALETFRWHEQALIDFDTYESLHEAHRLIADVVSFKGPHINHLTPRTLDIDACQQAMKAAGLETKADIEGPPPRRLPILLRQTSFKALTENVSFLSHESQAEKSGQHTARFGEIEQRGVALTPKGRALYDKLLAEAKDVSSEHSQQANYAERLSEAFNAFPDDFQTLLSEKLIYVEYALAPNARPVRDIDEGIALGDVLVSPMVYEDFLPVSAAGIFQSNLGDETQTYAAESNQAEFERALGKPVIEGFRWYDRQQEASRMRCLSH